MKILIAFVAMMLCVTPAWAEDASPIQTVQSQIPEKSVPPTPVLALTPVEVGKIQLLESYAFIQAKEMHVAGQDLKMTAQHIEAVAEDVQSNVKDQSEEPLQSVSQPTQSPEISVLSSPAESSDTPKDSVSVDSDVQVESDADPVSDNLVQFLSEKSSALQKGKSDLLKLKTDGLFLKAKRKNIEMKPLHSEDSEKMVIFGTVDFTRQIRGVHYLIHPPERLHPWMKWLLYTSRISPEMLEAYYGTVNKSEYLYRLAVKSKGKLKIRYRGQIMDIPVFMWPDQAEGKYELVQPLQIQTPSGPSSNPAFTPPTLPN